MQLTIKDSDEKFESDNKNFEYKKLISFKSKRPGYSFAFNTNNTIFFMGSINAWIKQYAFNNRRKLIQTLVNSLRDMVTCLVWRRKSNSLISGHFDGIIIWELNKINQLRPFQILFPEVEHLKCMILSDDEDLLISGSFDGNIQLWNKESEYWNCQQIFKASITPKCLSLNPLQNKLILCGFRTDHYIQGIGQLNNENWMISQNIKVNVDVDILGHGICFINDNQSFNNSNLKNSLEIYELNQENNEFVKSSQHKSEKSFFYVPCQFIQERSILIVKQGKFIHHFIKDKNRDCFLQHTIKFGSSHIYGRTSNDGLYQVTWDETEPYNLLNQGSFEIQIRKIRYCK